MKAKVSRTRRLYPHDHDTLKTIGLVQYAVTDTMTRYVFLERTLRFYFTPGGNVVDGV